MKKICLIVLLMFCFVISFAAGNAEQAGLTKLTDFAAAQKLAGESKRPILLVFSGSDWCTWCIRLDKEVFSTEEFTKWAEANVIVFFADFPIRKRLPVELKKQNNILKNKYNVRGFPTVFLLNADGSVILKTGYQHGGVQNYIEHLEKAITNKR